MLADRPDYQQWLKTIPRAIREDPIWTASAYRFACFLADDAWDDLGKLHAERRTWQTAVQLGKALDSMPANFSEGYAKWSIRDRIRFYEYGMTSAREAKYWYFKARRVVGYERASLQLDGISEVSRMLTTIIARERKKLDP